MPGREEKDKAEQLWKRKEDYLQASPGSKPRVSSLQASPGSKPGVSSLGNLVLKVAKVGPPWSKRLQKAEPSNYLKVTGGLGYPHLTGS